ncbi:MAG: PKD domain-containing protein, partial [Bacteroidales bacterium]|nr:PKD domain-containing protein [Bacteroidales bacterium]
FAWYQITGSRQDYTNYYDGNREFTLEISIDKTPNANNLPIFWNYNYRSMINLLKQANYGIQGVITDCETQQPIEATIFVEQHDAVYSKVTSKASDGTYYRPIKAGSYNVTYSAEGYYPQTFSIEIADRESFIQNVELCQGSLIADFSSDVQSTPIHTSVHFSDATFGNPTSWEWTFFGGTPFISNEQNPTVLYEMEGSFDVMLVVTKTVAKEILTDTIIKHHYITANNQFIIQNGTFTTCSGLFLDDGGLEMNYQDNKDYQMTFYPADPTAQLQFEFLDFATEYDYDFLKIYDASSNTSSALIGSYSGTNSPGIVTATNNEGALTFVFSADRNTNDRGWKAAISCQGGEMNIPIADFSADVVAINVGESVQFSDESANNPTSWFWTFEGGTPSFSDEQNPNVTYTNEGVYNVTLTVSNSVGNDTKVENDFISVSSVVDIDEEIVDNQVTIFPNPASENAFIQSKNIIQKIEIYNTFGQLLKEIPINSNTYQLTTNNLYSGLYFVRMYIQNQVTTKRWVILK